MCSLIMYYYEYEHVDYLVAQLYLQRVSEFQNVACSVGANLNTRTEESCSTSISRYNT